MSKKQTNQRPKTCVCGCGRPLNPPHTGHNFATPACVLRAALAEPKLRDALGENSIQEAIKFLESSEEK